MQEFYASYGTFPESGIIEKPAALIKLLTDARVRSLQTALENSAEITTILSRK